MKLSEAIRLGAMATRQSRGAFSRQRRKYFFFGPVVGETCALGAAYHAIGGRSHFEPATDDTQAFRGVIKKGHQMEIMETPTEWLTVMHSGAMCPVCAKLDQVRRMIPHLNDDHKWTREQIATWVEALESPRALAAVDPVGELAERDPTTRV